MPRVNYLRIKIMDGNKEKTIGLIRNTMLAEVWLGLTTVVLMEKTGAATVKELEAHMQRMPKVYPKCHEKALSKMPSPKGNSEAEEQLFKGFFNAQIQAALAGLKKLGIATSPARGKYSVEGTVVGNATAQKPMKQASFLDIDMQPSGGVENVLHEVAAEMRSLGIEGAEVTVIGDELLLRLKLPKEG